jgi:hypothetical protein
VPWARQTEEGLENNGGVACRRAREWVLDAATARAQGGEPWAGALRSDALKCRVGARDGTGLVSTGVMHCEVSASEGTGCQREQQIGTGPGRRCGIHRAPERRRSSAVLVVSCVASMGWLVESVRCHGQVRWRTALHAHWQRGARQSNVGGEPAPHAQIGGVGVKEPGSIDALSSRCE